MTQGRKTSLTITLTPQERLTLRSWVLAPNSHPMKQQRARAVLLRDAGNSISTIARKIGLSRRHCYKWLWRFQDFGVAGLDNAWERCAGGGDA